MDVFSVEFVVQFFGERFRTTFFFFFGEVGELAEAANYDDSFEPLATEEGAVSNNVRMDQKPNKYPNYPNSQTLKSFR